VEYRVVGGVGIDHCHAFDVSYGKDDRLAIFRCHVSAGHNDLVAIDLNLGTLPVQTEIGHF
jgi:hypothetical protein